MLQVTNAQITLAYNAVIEALYHTGVYFDSDSPDVMTLDKWIDACQNQNPDEIWAGTEWESDRCGPLTDNGDIDITAAAYAIAGDTFAFAWFDDFGDLSHDDAVDCVLDALLELCEQHEVDYGLVRGDFDCDDFLSDLCANWRQEYVIDAADPNGDTEALIDELDDAIDWDLYFVDDDDE